MRRVACKNTNSALQHRDVPMRSDASLPSDETHGEQGMSSRELEIQKIKKDWAENPRWKGIKRGYAAEDVHRLRGSIAIEHTLAKRGSEKLWKLMQERPFVNSLG